MDKRQMNLAIVFAAVAVLALFAGSYLLPRGEEAAGAASTAYYKCEDTDAISTVQNPFLLPGKAYLVSLKTGRVYGPMLYDSCASDTKLKEAYCYKSGSNVYATQMTIDCVSRFGSGSICKDGRCTIPETYRCVDTDAGRDDQLQIQGKTYLVSNQNGAISSFSEDKCDNSSKLIEGFCYGGGNIPPEVRSYTVDCVSKFGKGAICKEGACVEQPADIREECMLGQTKCTDATAYLKCGQFDSDLYFEWSSPIKCSLGKVCVGGECIQPTVCTTDGDCDPGWICGKGRYCIPK